MSDQKRSFKNPQSQSPSEDAIHVPDPSLLEAYHYVSSVPGKDVRGKLIDCFQLWLQVSNPGTLQSVKDIIGDLHNASLLVDDIEDNSKLRRGQPVAHGIFGIPHVLNCANYVYFLALDKCQRLNNPKATSIFVSELLNLHRGQGYDIMWRDNLKCPTEEQYCQMVIDKTGGLFRLAVGLIQASATMNQETDFTPLVNNLGLYFQIRDDLINLCDEDYFKSKSFCEDLTEGKFSFPIIHCIRETGENDSRLLSILKQRTDDVDIKKYAQSLMRTTGSFKYTRDKCIALKNDILEQIESLGGNPPLEKLIYLLDVQVEKLDISNNTSTVSEAAASVIKECHSKND
eukprot:CAMPEP_0204624710 /NCGR_PEP_ID=MMETSP0717-20131115/10426_1 /ASSEMBLY_ACC=CAM_ASM_000666 /TAXON_ID=230516 /ORGANISM="Chaetoceros curvisetus" /LENGTH=343 /DNA_ID=CAMNT_0051640189 /DNA_START=117 /DNA_END=1148 /DNA_ORIENTATION=-